MTSELELHPIKSDEDDIHANKLNNANYEDDDDYYDASKSKRNGILSSLTDSRTYIPLLFTLVFIVWIGVEFVPSYSSTSVGPSHPSYSLVKSIHLPEHNANMHFYSHDQTSAEFIGYTPHDPAQDKVFGISFRTLPTDNTGVPHILEHSVLSGSKNYPSKDPFLHLLKGSLHTFLNAMTYNDRTVFPIASRNTKDWKNLMNVYLDAVFKPLCVEEEGWWVLKQEGWSFEVYDDGPDSTGDLEYKGVVYSEMKGVYSDPENVLDQKTYQLLFPDTTYRFDSGGDPTPTGIPTLTHEQFTSFYKNHYHPTNSKIFVSGTNQDIFDALEMADGYLSEYKFDGNKKKDSRVQFQPKKFNHFIFATHPYPVEELKHDEGQDMFKITWLLNDDHFDPKTELAMFVLDYLLVGKASSPLNKQLMESGLGTNLIGYGMDTGLLQSTFEVGMKGVKGSDINSLEALIMQTLTDLATNGFEQDDMTAALNSIEFDLREMNLSGSRPAGISTFLRIMRKWNYDLPPESALLFQDTLFELKQDMDKQGSKMFQDLIQNYLVSNTHRVHIQLQPDDNYGAVKEEQEKSALRTERSKMSKTEYDNIVSQAKQLFDIQNTDDSPEVIASIPTLEMEDLDKNGVEYPIHVNENIYRTTTTVVKHPFKESAGIIYADFGIDVSSIPYEYVNILPFVTSLIMEAGTKDLSDVEIDRLIGIHTGGISVDLILEPVLAEGMDDTIVNPNTFMRTFLFFRGKSTPDNISSLFDIYMKLLTGFNIDNPEKVTQIIERKIGSYESSVTSSGHSFAYKRIAARYSALSYLSEKLNGITQLQALQEMLDQVKNDWNSFREKLDIIQQALMHAAGDGSIINLTGDNNELKSYADPAVQELVSSLGQFGDASQKDYRSVDHPWITGAQAEMTPVLNEGIVTSTLVSYVGEGGLMYDMDEKVSGATKVILQYLRNGYLWETVRAKNGAYGVFAQMEVTQGLLLMVSYRDPEIVKTIEAYDATADYLLQELASNSIDEKSIVTSIIGSIGSIDGSLPPPKSMGWASLLRWMSGKSAAYRQRWRDEILSTDVSDFADFADRLSKWKSSSIAVVGSNADIQSANADGNPELQIIELV